ncbi:MAG TPA: 50S ribosomal protein L17, partial [Cryomorphaceae bacterium]|nr:50S ribosomal protein L17 [Cryomorphaceae bacterium]
VLRQKEVVTELFNVVGPKVGDRPGGYTRIIKTGNRQGDNAEMCMIELVDFNDMYGKDEKKTTRRSRRAKTETAPAVEEAAPVAEVPAAAEESKEESAE